MYHTAYNAEDENLDACTAVTMKVNSILGCVAMLSGTYRVMQEERSVFW